MCQRFIPDATGGIALAKTEVFAPTLLSALVKAMWLPAFVTSATLAISRYYRRNAISIIYTLLKMTFDVARAPMMMLVP